LGRKLRKGKEKAKTFCTRKGHISRERTKNDLFEGGPADGIVLGQEDKRDIRRGKTFQVVVNRTLKLLTKTRGYFFVAKKKLYRHPTKGEPEHLLLKRQKAEGAV